VTGPVLTTSGRNPLVKLATALRRRRVQVGLPGIDLGHEVAVVVVRVANHLSSLARVCVAVISPVGDREAAGEAPSVPSSAHEGAKRVGTAPTGDRNIRANSS
jgi:hypothetical protein